MSGPNFLDVGKSNVDLTSFTVGGEAYEAGGCADTVFVQILNFDGTPAGTYDWLDLEGDFEPGWYDYDNDLAQILEGDVVLSAGEGMWVQGDDGFDLQVPALILK